MTYAIVGAGFCGLGVAAAFARYASRSPTGGNKIDFEIFEAEDALGGNWHHGVYETVHIISSKKTTEYADFPMPDTYPDFPSAAQMLAYLQAYAAHHRLEEKMRLSTRVVRIAPNDDEESTWRVAFEHGGKREEKTYEGVVVCNGHHWAMRMPSYPGTFDGEILHSKQYKSPKTLEGKRVLVIGGGNSACDIAVEAARFAASAHISLRRGYWFLPKTFLGVPLVELMRPWMPPFAQRAMARTVARLAVGPYDRYGLPEPDHRPFDRHPTINSELLYNLRHGEITPHPDIAKWDGKVVEFVDGTREDIDLVIAATGYDVSFPFVDDDVVKWKDGFPQLINGLMPPDRKNIYFFGFGQPRYGAGPLISAGADLLCTMVETQRRLDVPIGAVLERLGARPPRTWLQDPFSILRQVRMGKRLMPRLPRIARLLMQRHEARGEIHAGG
jgi:cation diffusion facilitator CzcD-associated flavoprotein CzcO